MRKRIIITALALLTGLGVSAQSDDFGMDFSVDAEKKLRPGMSLGIEGGARTQDNTSKIDRWSVGAAWSMRLYQNSHKTFSLKTGVKWEYLWVNNLAEVKPKYDEQVSESGTASIYEGYNEKHSYWRNRHRTSLAFTASYHPNKRWDFSLKETFQYSHFCKASTTVDKYRLDDSDVLYLKSSSTKDYGSKDKVVLRSRATAQYDIRHSRLDPYASVEYGCGLNYSASKWKFVAGADYKINKKNKLNLFYRFSHENDDDEPNGHLVGIGYGMKF